MKRTQGVSTGFMLVLGVACASAEQMPIQAIGLLPGDLAVAPATNSQQEHSVAKGGDQYLVVWSDSRARSAGSQSIQGDGDIFGIRLDAQGQAIDPVPFLVAGGMGLQRYPTAAWNGQNWLVIYQSQDPVGGYFETQIRAVRVSPQGEVLDPTPILLPPTQFSPSTIGMNVAGQNGQWLLIRCVYHSSGNGTYLGGQRVGGDGVLLDPAPVMLLDWTYGATRIVASSGEYLVAGPDWNNSSTFKASRVGLDGQPIGAAFGVPGLNLAGNGNEYYVTWISNFTNVVGSRMTSSGVLLNPSGTLLCSEPSIQYYHTNLAHDGTNWWFEWGAASTLRTMRIDASGAVLDPGGVLLPIVIGGTINQAYSVQLAPVGGGGVQVVWYDARVGLGYDANVFSLPVNGSNVPGIEQCISTSTANQRNANFSQGPNGTGAVAFVSEFADDDRVLVSLLSSTGAPLSTEPIEVYRGPTVGKAGIAWNGMIFMIAWDQGASGQISTQIKARRMSPDGTFLDPQPIYVMNGFNADVEALGEDFLVAAPRVNAYPEFIDLFANRIDGPTGTVLDGPAGLLLHAGYVNSMPRVRSDGTQWLVAAHSMWTHNSSQGDAILAKVPPVGPPVKAINPTPVAGGSGDLDIAFSGSKYLLVWRMNSLANANNYIAGRLMNADGTFVPGYFTVAEAPGRQLRPTVGWDGTSFVVAWEDQRNQKAFFDARTDIYGARVTEQGVLLDPSGFAIFATPEGDAAAALLGRSNGVTLAACSRFATTGGFDSYRIALARLGAIPGDINGDGKVDQQDLGILLSAYGLCSGQLGFVPEADLDKDGCIGQGDLGILLANYGL